MVSRIKEFFESIRDTIEFIFVAIILIIGYPFYKKSLKELWKKFIESREKY